MGLSSAFPDPVQDEFEGYWGDGEYLLHPVEGGTEPWLAEKAEMVDPSTWTITMRTGLKYQNGNPVTTEKVKSWLEHELSTSGEFGDKYAGATVTADDDTTLTVTFKTPQAGFETELSNYTLHFYDWEMVESVGQDFNKLAGMGVYTGPYQISEITPEKWVYTANPNYWQGTPALEKIELLNVADDQAAVKAVQAGEADVYVFADAALKPTVDAVEGLHFNPGGSAEYEALLPNLNKAPWSDPVVRQALAMTIDSADISQKGVFGVFPEIHGLFPSDSEFAHDWVNADIDGANAMLDEAGWTKGSDGVREKDGVRLEGELLSYASNLNNLAVPLAENAKAAGFSITPKQLDYQVWNDAVSSGDFDLSMQNNENFGINGDIAVSCNLYFAPDSTGAASGAGDDPTIKEACAKLSETRDPATVKSVLATVQERNGEMAFVVPVTQRVSSWVTNDTWKSAAPDAFYVPITWQTKAG
ncbi:MAG: ABC transporter substrate-binding protein [Ilumatobacteraceae bacterium]